MRNHPSPIVTSPALAAAGGLRALGLRSPLLFRALGSHPGGLAEWLSPAAALRAAVAAYDEVPAYGDFVRLHGGGRPKRLRELPEMDKTSYIDAYPLAARCTGGAIPTHGAELDESSGSSGRPYTWVRSQRELAEIHRSLRSLVRLLFGPEVVTLNGFSMGAWATGTNVAKALAANGLVESPGPDVGKILAAIELLGPGRRYLIAGYPPFLKQLIDEGDRRGMDWSRLDANGVVGGEGMTEGQRSYLERRLRRVYSAYGASDLDIGVAAELPVSVWIRRRAAANPELARALFGTEGRLPMLFQYNPLDYHVETSPAGELVVTVNRRSVLSPRVRYNIHDAGGTLPFATAMAICRDFDLDPVVAARAESGVCSFRLPFLYVAGRSDSTISFMGANIYPEDVEAALFEDSGVAGRLGAFCLELVDLPAGGVRPCVHVEVAGEDAEAVAGSSAELASRLSRVIARRLAAASRDFAAAVAEDPATGDLQVQLHEPGSGPFAGNADRIKRRYVVR